MSETNGRMTFDRFPERFYRDSLAAWQSYVEADRQGAVAGFPYPSLAEFRTMLTALMDATLATEEKRSIRARAVFTPTIDSLEAWVDASTSRSPWFLTRLYPEMPLSAAAIRSLAPALDVDDSYLVIMSADRMLGSNMAVSGVLSGARGMRLMREGRAFHCWSSPCVLAVESAGVAKLMLAAGDRDICEVTLGGYVVRPGPGWSQRPDDALYRFVLSEAEQLEHEVMDRHAALGAGVVGTASAGHYQACIGEILSRINEARHGGTVLLLDSDYVVGDERLQDVLRIKYTAPQGRLWELLVQAWGDALGNEQTEGNSEEPRLDFGTAHSLVSETVRFVSGLAAVDGALVLNKRLAVLGFGGEVTVAAPNLDTVDLTQSDGSLSAVAISSFGTRHRSAARFVSAVERSVAFVISSDGGVRAFRRVGQRVRMWKDITFARF